MDLNRPEPELQAGVPRPPAGDEAGVAAPRAVDGTPPAADASPARPSPADGANAPRSEPDLDEAEPSANRLLQVVGQFWAWLFLLVLVIFFSITGRGFFDLFNFQALGANQSIMLIMALGQTFVIIAGGIDLSTGFVMGLSSVGAALAMSRLGGSAPLALVVLAGFAAALVAGLPAGLVNGVLIARLRVPPFIGTLGMYGIARGVGFILSGGQPVSIQVNGLGQIGNGYLLYYYPGAGLSLLNPPAGLQGTQLRQVVGILPHPLTLAIVLVVACWFLLARTRFGQHTYAIGGNAEAALRAGIPVRTHTIRIYLLSALLAAIAGLLYSARFTNGAANAGDALLLDSIAAVVIGGASLFGGAGTVFGTVIGALIIGVIQNGLVILGINPFWQFVTVGIVIILAVLADQAKARVVR
jgi:ribose/xylose/arabinose/galactoside ABC-type transport system permease subunit